MTLTRQDVRLGGLGDMRRRTRGRRRRVGAALLVCVTACGEAVGHGALPAPVAADALGVTRDGILDGTRAAAADFAATGAILYSSRAAKHADAPAAGAEADKGCGSETVAGAGIDQGCRSETVAGVGADQGCRSEAVAGAGAGTGTDTSTVAGAAPPIGAMICSGTLIAPDVVLAAGHCQVDGIDVGGAALDYYFSLSADVSQFGPHVLDFPPDAVRVAHFVPHPDYTGLDQNEPHDAAATSPKQVADLALLFLQSPVTTVTPAQLLPLHQQYLLKEGREVLIVGYGRRSLHFFGADGGVKTHGRSTLHKLRSHELQIGRGPGEAHKCWGDSGGPTFVRGVGDALYLIGVTSRAADVGGCRSGGIDTRVDAFRDWIDATIAAVRNGPRLPTL